jgi:Ni/Fe-hydrogenase 1 B-type cytochrome subunit
MTLIEPVKQEPGPSSQPKTYSSAMRFWHWANAIVISGSLITVLINSTVLKPRKMAPDVMGAIQKDNPAFTINQAQSAIRFLEDKVWEWHVYFGFALTALLLLRIIAEFFELAERKFINRFKKSWQQYNVIKKEREKAKHELVVKSIYIIFYIVLLTMVLTGLSLAFQDSLPFSKGLQNSIKEVHGFCMYLVLGFITIHLAGVFLAERKDSKGIVSNMINGGGSV